MPRTRSTYRRRTIVKVLSGDNEYYSTDCTYRTVTALRPTPNALQVPWTNVKEQNVNDHRPLTRKQSTTMGPKVNAKAQAGRARKEETAVQKAAAANAAKDAELAKEWSKGANEKGQSRVDDAGTY